MNSSSVSASPCCTLEQFLNVSHLKLSEACKHLRITQQQFYDCCNLYEITRWPIKHATPVQNYSQNLLNSQQQATRSVDDSAQSSAAVANQSQHPSSPTNPLNNPSSSPYTFFRLDSIPNDNSLTNEQLTTLAHAIFNAQAFLSRPASIINRNSGSEFNDNSSAEFSPIVKAKCSPFNHSLLMESYCKLNSCHNNSGSDNQSLIHALVNTNNNGNTSYNHSSPTISSREFAGNCSHVEPNYHNKGNEAMRLVADEHEQPRPSERNCWESNVTSPESEFNHLIVNKMDLAENTTPVSFGTSPTVFQSPNSAFTRILTNPNAYQSLQ